jgi:hypothetical protein
MMVRVVHWKIGLDKAKRKRTFVTVLYTLSQFPVCDGVKGARKRGSVRSVGSEVLGLVNCSRIFFNLCKQK